MRERTTWNRNEIAKQAAGHAKKADPYTMNQPEHAKAQPSADAYVIGTPSDFAEDVHPSSGTWEAEYSGGKVKRNEIGMPEFRSDTFNHAEKTASEDVIVKKAALCVRIARAFLPKSATEAAVEDQALSFMHLPDADLISTYNRLAQDQEQDKGQDEQQKQAQDQQQDQGKQAQDQQQDKGQEQQKQAQGQQQDQDKDQGKQAQDQQDKSQAQSEQKQAGELPPALKEHMEKKKEEAGDKKDDDGQKKEAQGDLSQIATALQAMQQGDMKQAEQALMAACQQMAQQMIQQMAQGQQQAPAQQQGQALAQQPQMAPTSDDQLLDQMLADQQPMQEVLATDIELEAPSMDVGDATLDPVADAQLLNLFANQGEAQQAEQAKQAAHGVRTASTRTVGARPTGGVSRLGGVVGSAPASSGDKNLSSIWNSAPDVSDVFGVPRS